MRILNPHKDPYLDFAEEERRRGKRLFAPWTTSDPELLKLAERYFPQVPIIAAQRLEKPDLSPVEILALKDYPALAQLKQEACFVAVGGPPAATVALEQAFQGRAVLYVSDLEKSSAGKLARPIWAGAGNHGEPDALTEGPAYIAGHQPFSFVLTELLRACRPTAYNTRVLDADYPWLSLNFGEWLRSPRQWPAAFRVAWGNHLASRRYAQELREGKVPEVLQRMRQRTQLSWKYLENLNQRLGGLFREPRGSLLIAGSPQQAEGYQRDAAFLKEEGLQLLPLTPEQVREKYGLVPRQAFALMEKTHDFIFETDFLPKITNELLKQGGELKNNWRLLRVYVDTDQDEGGVLEFRETSATGEPIQHYRRFSRAHLSLGPTPFRPWVYDLISVTGVSINALILGAELTGGPLVCGGSNHIVPLLAPQTIEMKDPDSGQTRPVNVTFARISAAGCVSPLDRGNNWYTYDGRHAVHLLHRVRETLPPEMSVKVLSVTGCNRVIGKDGQQMELHPTLVVNGKKRSCPQVTIQIGAGGGGLTQMGAVPGEKKI
jgi:hypothetical protein